MSKSIPSPRQIAANRANAAKSTGPRTEEGKQRSAQNARKHGFASSKYAVVRFEELDALTRLRDDAVAAYQPVNSQELFAVERIALAQLSLLRCAALEAGLLCDAMNEAYTPGNFPVKALNDEVIRDIGATRAQNRTLGLAVGFERVVRKSDAWKLFLRYQAQSERLYRRAIEEFERLKALRPELPNEPISALEPENVQLMDPPDSPPADVTDPTEVVTSQFGPSHLPGDRTERPPQPLGCALPGVR
ncbi:MAG TPA: hypothetical protein VMB03_06800 [Bryobacteraceae bacterium]|nr:hypothetical protein [Bryobacteraceae bacterium]